MTATFLNSGLRGSGSVHLKDIAEVIHFQGEYAVEAPALAACLLAVAVHHPNTRDTDKRPHDEVRRHNVPRQPQAVDPLRRCVRA
jgi:hypothetical protein